MSDREENCGCEHDKPPESCKPIIDYPCTWSYTVIGTEEHALRQAVTDVLEDKEYDLVPSRASSRGKYVSMKLTLTVQSEEQRNQIHERLGEHPDVRVAF